MHRSSTVFLVISIVFAVLSIFFYNVSSSNPSALFQPDAIVRLDRVIDGDTIWVRSIYGYKDGQLFKVRLADVDAPERGEPGFSEATRELNELLHLAGCIVLDVDNPPYDRYGRVVAVAYVPIDDRLINVNAYLAENGFARYVDYSGSFHPEDFQYLVHISPELRSLLNRYCT